MKFLTKPSLKQVRFQFCCRLAFSLLLTGTLVWVLGAMYESEQRLYQARQGHLGRMRQTLTPFLLHQVEAQYREDTAQLP